MDIRCRDIVHPCVHIVFPNALEETLTPMERIRILFESFYRETYFSSIWSSESTFISFFIKRLAVQIYTIHSTGLWRILLQYINFYWKGFSMLPFPQRRRVIFRSARSVCVCVCVCVCVSACLCMCVCARDSFVGLCPLISNFEPLDWFSQNTIWILCHWEKRQWHKF